MEPTNTGETFSVRVLESQVNFKDEKELTGVMLPDVLVGPIFNNVKGIVRANLVRAGVNDSEDCRWIFRLFITTLN